MWSSVVVVTHTERNRGVVGVTGWTAVHKDDGVAYGCGGAGRRARFNKEACRERTLFIVRPGKHLTVVGCCFLLIADGSRGERKQTCLLMRCQRREGPLHCQW